MRAEVARAAADACLGQVLAALGDCAVVEQFPLMEGRRMNMLVAPKPGARIIVPPRAGSLERDERADAGRGEPQTEPSTGLGITE